MCGGSGSSYNNIVEGIIESDGRELEIEWENEIVDDFREVRSRNNERVVLET